MSSEIYDHLSILAAHLAQKLIESEKIDQFCKSPCDLAVICHDKKYINKELIGKMMFHIAEYGYLERRGEVFILEDNWRRVLPAKINSQNALREINSYPIYLLQERIIKNFLELVRNETVKIDLKTLIYFLDTIDSSKALQELSHEAVSTMNFHIKPKSILDLNYGLGYSAIQLATIFPKTDIYSINLNPLLKDAYEFTILRHQKPNLKSVSRYPTDVLNQIMREKVDMIFAFNPLGLKDHDVAQVYGIANQVSNDKTRMISVMPFRDEPKNTIIPEWLGLCVEGLGNYIQYDTYKILLSQYGFELAPRENTSNVMHAKFVE
ncbi:MAG: hypothetical protein ACTSP7_01575 [Candidatus Heimdallarchaeota archaeon]